MVKKNNLEDMMDILSSYSICQEKYKKLTGKYYEPKDF